MAELIGAVFELAGVVVLVAGAVFAILSYARRLIERRQALAAYRALRRDLGRALLVGLEFLVAAGIIRSVAVAPTFQSVGVLGLLILVRTFLSWSLEVEVHGEWPWERYQSHKDVPADANGL
jgi:uncharacterized membrane protein